MTTDEALEVLRKANLVMENPSKNDPGWWDSVHYIRAKKADNPTQLYKMWVETAFPELTIEFALAIETLSQSEDSG